MGTGIRARLAVLSGASFWDSVRPCLKQLLTRDKRKKVPNSAAEQSKPKEKVKYWVVALSPGGGTHSQGTEEKDISPETLPTEPGQQGD